MAFPDLHERVTEVRGRIAHAAQRGGHGQAVRLVAVTKTHGPEAVEAAWAAGITDVGENKVQEASQKQDALAGSQTVGAGLRWHLIGHLQSNKAKALARFDLFHALDRDSLVDAVRAVGAKLGRPVPVLVQVNVSGEETKGGFAPAQIGALADRLAAMPELQVQGVMTMAPFDAAENELRAVFVGARAAKDVLRAAGLPATELSMGMSGDYELAVEEGATLVRLGTILFGARE
ncbi:MAG: YggS family pyridoxal phosphate-dependent enzyme [Gemmatimonadaceae bacterium]